MDTRVVIVSACLAGLKTRYNGEDAYSQEVTAALKDAVIVPVCPEQLGGLPTPRPACEITGGDGTDVLAGRTRVADEHGSDVTENLIRGAKETLKIARLAGAAGAYLKEKSPSCGVTAIKSGGATIAGRGVTAALLEKNGIPVKGI